MNRFIKVASVLFAVGASALPALAEGPYQPAPEHYGSQVTVAASEIYSAREGIALGLKADEPISVTKGVSAPVSNSRIGSR